MKIEAEQIKKAINAVKDVTVPFISLVFYLSVAIIALGILLGVVMPQFSFGSLQTTFDNLTASVLNFTTAGFGYTIDGGTIALTLLVLAVVFIVFAKILGSDKSSKGKNM